MSPVEHINFWLTVLGAVLWASQPVVLLRDTLDAHPILTQLIFN